MGSQGLGDSEDSGDLRILQVPGSGVRGRGSRSQVPGSKFQVPGSRFQFYFYLSSIIYMYHKYIISYIYTIYTYTIYM